MAFQEEVLREYAPIGKYRIRLVRNLQRPSSDPVLDIREYALTEMFEGFTRRGIRLNNPAEVDLLKDILVEILSAGEMTIKKEGA